MPTKLSRICTGIIEAVWLAAVILVPVYFNIYSSRIFEPDKITLLRSLALLILGAWLVKLIEEGGATWDRLQPGGSKLRYIVRFPMVAPMLAMGILYIVATIFSVTPRVSLLGSYQRLQGTYTTLSYIVVFAAIVGNLRKRAQVERLITIIIIASLPVSLYGVVQKYRLDPIPWGGDTSLRIAANMGNSIFVAAYLIMVFPLTVGRIIQSIRAIIKDEIGVWNNVARATIYVFIGALQLIALYMSQSRGPALGLIVGQFFLFLLISLHWQARWLTISMIGGAAVVGIFLLVFNIKGGPLDGLRQSPAIGRFGSLLDAQSNSAQVRKYIWEGASNLVSIHSPLSYPDGSTDRFNFLRPAIGYGPESMYVAYNPFYIPKLALVEKRNASPDRSHNETWDSLVITGVFGIVVYLTLFISIFYYGLKWIGYIGSRRLKYLFFILTLAGGAIGGGGFILWRGVEYFGVGLPFGITAGLAIYLIIEVFTGGYRPPQTLGESTRSLTLIILLTAIISHFVEINFGIAIVSTRSYFWLYSGLIVVIGLILPIYGQYDFMSLGLPQSAEPIGDSKRGVSQSQKRKKRGKSPTPLFAQKQFNLIDDVLPGALITTILMITIGYDALTNPGGLSSAFDVIRASLTQLPNQNWAYSQGMLALVFITLFFTTIILTAEIYLEKANISWWKVFGMILAISTILVAIYWIWHAGSLASIAGNTATDLSGVLRQVSRYEWLLTRYYIFIFMLVIALGVVLAPTWAGATRAATIMGGISGVILSILVVILIVFSNLRVIQADIVFKLAEPFTRSGQWPVAITIYNRANQLAPNEDYYYLFLGRAYLEQAKTLSDTNDRENLIRQAESDLRRSQSINPLNTDHTANLARLYSLWASFTQDQTGRFNKGEISSDYFSKALQMSPQSARLWDEWALLYLNILQLPEEALTRLERSLEIDPEYHWTYAMMGDLNLRSSRLLDDPGEVENALQEAVKGYTKALELVPSNEMQSIFGYRLALASAYVQLGDYDQAIRVYEETLDTAPAGAEKWRIEEAIANLYLETGDIETALIHFQNGLNLAPEDQKSSIQEQIDQISQSQP